MAAPWRKISLSILAAAIMPAAALADDCAARCRALEMQCLQQSKGDTAKCNSIVVKCYQTCRKPR